MSSSDQVHWHEGLFLQPHHLQAMQRFLLEQAAAVRGQCSPYPYGVISHELSTEALKNNRVQFDHLHVVMRSGLEVIYPGNAELDPLEIGSSIGGSDGLLIELSVPTWQPDGANVVSDSSNGSGNRFRVREILRPDENTGLNKQPVAVRRLNAKLILAGSDRRGGTETLPVVRVLQGTDGRPTADPQYIPPCMAIGGSSALHMIVSDISDRQQAVRKQLLPKLTRDGFSFGKLQPAQMETWQRFRVAARYGAMLPALVRATGATPFSAYMELAALLGELAAIDPRQPDDFEPPPYEHENLALCFFELAERIGRLSELDVKSPVMTAEFKPDGMLLTAQLTQEHLSTATRYYLAFKNAGSTDSLAALVQDKNVFKLMAKTEALKAAIWGIKLEPVWATPTDVDDPNAIYFRLDLNDAYSKDRWTRMLAPENRNLLSIRCPAGRLPPDSAVKLVMPLTKA